jgi:predicted permease
MSHAVAAHWQAQRSLKSRVRFVLLLAADALAAWPGAWRRHSPRRHSIAGGFPVMRRLASDLREVYRLFRRAPAFALGATLTLSLGIGASTAIFSLADATVLRPLPIPEPDRVIQTEFSWSYPDFDDVADQQTMFSSVAAWAYPPVGIEHDGVTLQINGAVVSSDYFTLAGQHHVVGRLLNAADHSANGVPAAVLSERLWRRVFASNAAVIGSTLMVNRRPVTIVGVAPASFRGLSLQIAPEIYLPLRALPDLATGFFASPGFLANRGRVWLNWAGRLKPGVTATEAERQVRQIYWRTRPTADAKNVADPTSWFTSITNRAMGASNRPGGPSGAADLRRFIWVLLGATAVTLLLTCATVANLLLVRAERRRHELSVRGALGGDRVRLARLLLVEGLGIGLAGGLAGAGGAALILKLLETFALPGQISITDLRVSVNAAMLATSAGVGLLTAVLFGMSPVYQLRTLDVAEALRGGGRVTTRRPVRTILVGAQVALCVLLMSGSLAFGRALQFALAVDLGFNTTDTTIVAVNPTLVRYTPERVGDFQQQVLDVLRARPQVRAAAWTAVRPMSGVMTVAPPVIHGRPRAQGDDAPVQANVVSDGYFDALEIPIESGRAFTERDTASMPRVAVVGASMAQKYWPAGGAVGGRLSLEDAGAADPKWITVVGVAGDIHRAIGAAAPLLMYSPAKQAQGPFGETNYLIVRTAPHTTDTATDLRATLHGIDAGMPVTSVVPMRSHVGATLMAHRLGLTLFLLFTGVSVLLTGLGLYAIVAAAVTQRTREIGIRIALGANARTVLRMVVTQSLGPVVAGLGAGLAAAAFSANAIASFMFALPPLTPLVVAALVAVIGCLALVAVIQPVKRALAVSPTVTLKAE